MGGGSTICSDMEEHKWLFPKGLHLHEMIPADGHSLP